LPLISRKASPKKRFGPTCARFRRDALPRNHLRGVAPIAARDEGAASVDRLEGDPGAGNIYRHDYEDVAAQQVWDAVRIDLPLLRSVIEQELTAVDRSATE